MKTFKIKDISTYQTYGEIACSFIPQLNSLIKICDEKYNDYYYRIFDIVYIFYEGSNDFDCDLFVSKELCGYFAD
jgi:hypothetical protein